MKPSVIIKDGREAAYLQVARQLRSRLGEGKLLRDDGRLPSFRQLSAEYEVSICVIQQAMRLLREESLIEVHHGRSGRVVADAPVKTAILKLGLIHPYAPDGPFGRQLPYALLKSVEEQHCNAMVTVRSSRRNAKQEREIAENLLYNGFDGIILSPEDTFANAAFFEELSQSVPVMLLDQAPREMTIEEDPENVDGLNFLTGRTMAEINRKAFEGTVLAHADGGTPSLVVRIPAATEENLGYLIYFFEKACAVSGYMLGVNPFDQPGVESYKRNMFALLGKPGYEAEREALEKRLGR